MIVYEVMEHYDYGTKNERFNRLVFDLDGKPSGKIPKSHSISYYFDRTQRIVIFGDTMGLDFWAEHPGLTYLQCVEATKDLKN